MRKRGIWNDGYLECTNYKKKLKKKSKKFVLYKKRRGSGIMKDLKVESGGSVKEESHEFIT